MAKTTRGVLAGSSSALTAQAIVLSLGLLAFVPLGAGAAELGVRAALVAVIAGGLVYALTGTTPAPAGGPSSPTTLIFAGLVAQLALDPQLNLSNPQGLVALMAVMASMVVLSGLLQIGLGLAGLGRLARYVPQPVLAGFMNGVALLILFAQLRPLLGLAQTDSLSSAGALSLSLPWALAIGLATAACIWLAGWKWRKVPAPLLGLLAGVALYGVLTQLFPEARLGPTVGALPQGWVWPDALQPLGDSATRALWQRHAASVFTTAVVLALIGSLESLFAAMALDQLSKSWHDSRRELMALGGANIASGLCGGLPLVLLRARSQALIESGAGGRFAVIVGALAFALLLALGGPLLAYLPTAVLAGIMVTIAVALSDRWTRQMLRQWRAGERSPEMRLSLAVVAAVCVITVGMGFVAGVAVGVLLSMGVFIRSMNRSLLRERFSADRQPSRRVYAPQQEALLQQARRQITVFELEGALFSAAPSA